MKRLLVFFSLACLLTLCLGGTARALSSPTVDSIIPATAPNEVDTAVVITGSGFSSDPTAPTIALDTTPLTAVTFVSDTTLTATVPSGMAPGLYGLTVTNPDSGSATLTGAFTVTLPPTVSAIDPSAAYNDIDTSVTITGTNFATGAGGTIPPTVSLANTPSGSTPLTDVALVDATILTATVPWGMDAGTYDLTVTNPDGGTASQPAAFTVGAGIGQWNAGDLYGGQMQQLLMKPGDRTTLYASAYGVKGLFRSTDAGEQWTFVTDKVWPNANGFVLDPLHPDWLYVINNPDGLRRSTDEGDTWTNVMPYTWPNGLDLQAYPRVFVSPYESLPDHPQALFVGACNQYTIPEGTGPEGLIKSTDGGVHWNIVLGDVPVQAVAFDPNDHSHMVLVTSDARIYTSSTWGDSWNQVTTTGLTPSSLGLGGSITYNPGGSEVWINAPATVGGGIFTCAATDLASWHGVGPSTSYGSWFLQFTSADSVYISRFHSTDGGSSWAPFGPSPWYGPGDFVSDPTDPQTAYITNDAVGVQKTTDLLDPTPTWQDKVQGLTALSCSSMGVSWADPLCVYAAFYGPLGIYRSLDGTSTWRFLPIPGASQVRRVLVDPFDSQRVYAGADSGFYTSTNGGVDWSSTDGGGNWAGTAWNLPPDSPSKGFVDMAADPYQQGHLLACFGSGDSRLLYRSTDDGASWLATDVNPGLGLYDPHCIAFDPATPGTVYFTTNGVYKSTDGGATWQRVDDLTQPGMVSSGGDITVATHPQRMVAVSSDAGQFYRSTDDGATWQKAASTELGGVDLFVDFDSTRLYRAAFQGLFFSSDAGDSWHRAAGALGQVQTTALGYGVADGHAILYVATNGGHTGATGGTAAASSRRGAAAASTLVNAGVYRYVVVTPALTLRLSGLRAGALRLGHRVTAKGTVTPIALAGSKLTLVVQRRHDGRWRTVKTVTRTIGAAGAYSWKYQPAKKGSYRMRATMDKTATRTAARSAWRTFRVK